MLRNARQAPFPKNATKKQNKRKNNATKLAIAVHLLLLYNKLAGERQHKSRNQSSTQRSTNRKTKTSAKSCWRTGLGSSLAEFSCAWLGLEWFGWKPLQASDTITFFAEIKMAIGFGLGVSMYGPVQQIYAMGLCKYIYGPVSI